MDDAAIRGLFARLERVVPDVAPLDGRTLSEDELIQTVFGMSSSDPAWRHELRADQLNLSYGTPHWFVTDLELEVDAAWLTDADVRRVVADLERFSVRCRLERIDRSHSQPEMRLRLRLRLWMIRRPAEPPPPREFVKYGTSIIGRSHDVVTCEHCDAAHELTIGVKGNIGDSAGWATEYCLRCSRGVFDIRFYTGYLLRLV